MLALEVLSVQTPTRSKYGEWSMEAWGTLVGGLGPVLLGGIELVLQESLLASPLWLSLV